MEEDLYKQNNRKNSFLCDVCGYKWEAWHQEDTLRKELSLENDILEEAPAKCPSCGNLSISEL